MKLNNEQKNIVEANHNLIYKFAQNYHLDLEQYYDVLAIGLCKAALYYKGDTEFQFSTYAFKVMKNEYLNAYRSQFGCKRNEGDRHLISYNERKFSNGADGECETLDFLGTSDEDMIDDVLTSVIKDDLLKRFTKKNHKQMVWLLLNGHSQLEVAKIMDVSHTMVYHIRKKLQNICKNELLLE